jgi:chaperonin GroES
VSGKRPDRVLVFGFRAEPGSGKRQISQAGFPSEFQDRNQPEVLKVMQIRPLYDRLVVRRIEEKEQSQGGIIIPDSAKEKPQKAEVVAVGRGKRLENGTLASLEVKVGDKILFGKYSGSEVPRDLLGDGAEYLILREDEILAVIDPAA